MPPGPGKGGGPLPQENPEQSTLGTKGKIDHSSNAVDRLELGGKPKARGKVKKLEGKWLRGNPHSIKNNA